MKFFLKCSSLIFAFMILFSFQEVKAKETVSPIDIVPYIEMYAKEKKDSSDTRGTNDFVLRCWKAGYEKYMEKTGKKVELPKELTKTVLAKSCPKESYDSFKLPDTIARSIGNIPKGAIVYFQDNNKNDGVTYCGSHEKGLSALYIGSSKVVHNLNGKVRIESINSVKARGYKYVDWYYCRGMHMDQLESVPKNSTLKINLTSYPTKLSLGSSYGLKGTITSNFYITEVYAGIYKGTKAQSYVSEKPYTNRFDIYSSKINTKLKFGDLPVGTYTIYIKVTDSTGKEVVLRKEFEVYKIASTLKVNLTSYPKDNPAHKQGEGFGLRGTVTSNYIIRSVYAHVFDSNGKKMLEAYDTPNSKSLDIKSSNINNDLKFKKLPVGKYSFEIRALDKSGKIITWKKSFTVVGKNSNKDENIVTGTVDIPSSWKNLSIRKGASTNYDIAGSMKDGEKCTVHLNKAKNGWYYIDYKGIKGYAAGNRIKY